jgi:galactonate dehydratase
MPAAITDLAAYPVREPAGKREYVLVMVSTDAGLTGVGEGAAQPDAAAVAAAVIEQKKALVGRDPTAVEMVRPPLAAARAALNMALLDLTGQLARAPVYEVLGGPTRFKARAATTLTTDAALDAARAAGFRALFVPVEPPSYRNSGQGWVRGVRRRLEALRNSAGDDVDFILDCGGALTPGDAQILAREFERFHLLWLEEPCATINLEAAARISRESTTPIGFGRGILNNAGFQDLLRLDAIDVLRPDIALHGITQIRKAAALAETYYVAVAPFHRGGPVATAAALHLAASIPNFFVQEVPFPASDQDRRMRAELVSPAVESVTDGYFALPARPGLGVTLNPEALRKYGNRR